MKEKAILLLSGGLDSVNYLVLLHKKYDITAVCMDYGQKSRELDVIKYWCKKYNVAYKTINISKSNIWTNSLMKYTKVNALENQTIEEAQKKNIVEGRNPLFLFLASIYASKIGAKKVIIGFHKRPEWGGFKDSRTTYFKHMNKLIKETFENNDIKIIAPFSKLSVEDIAYRAYKLDNKIFDKSISCYEETECGVCVHCIGKRDIMKNVLYRSQAD